MCSSFDDRVKTAVGVSGRLNCVCTYCCVLRGPVFPTTILLSCNRSSSRLPSALFLSHPSANLLLYTRRRDSPVMCTQARVAQTCLSRSSKPGSGSVPGHAPNHQTSVCKHTIRNSQTYILNTLGISCTVVPLSCFTPCAKDWLEFNVFYCWLRMHVSPAFRQLNKNRSPAEWMRVRDTTGTAFLWYTFVLQVASACCSMVFLASREENQVGGCVCGNNGT